MTYWTAAGKCLDPAGAPLPGPLMVRCLQPTASGTRETVAWSTEIELAADGFYSQELLVAPGAVFELSVHWLPRARRFTSPAAGVTAHLLDLAVDPQPVEPSMLEQLAVRVASLEDTPPGTYDDTEVRALISSGDAAHASAPDPHPQYQTAAEVDARVQQVVGAAPAALDTLVEIAARIEAEATDLDALIGQVAAETTARQAADALLTPLTDPRLTDARTPTAHAHAITDLGVGTIGDGQMVVRSGSALIGQAIPTGGGGGGGGPLTGIGSPEGVVTAPVGTEYLDTAGTRGAWRWLKTAGTGNTGWVVTYGDTGWRNITSLAPDASMFPGLDLQYRRSTAYAQLYVAFTALTARSLPGNLIPASTPAGIQKPEKGPGWGPAYHFIPTGTTTGGGTVYTFLWNDNAGLSLDAAVGTSLRSVWTYPVASPWPTTLPGTPA